ncbi:hypothetical protein EDWATA_02487 [Edwardsiella tarda ATCC 23685]|uniref:Uncharacterized protein n=1 Tax=Edwardsiella tarda ATCC 23685 TaxID=500638 RepID=D4F6V3_EDWTA|nr:hypothetical protein EDWATA_02487 [Edwardsiella tarda ATCC 23685]
MRYTTLVATTFYHSARQVSLPTAHGITTAVVVAPSCVTAIKQNESRAIITTVNILFPLVSLINHQKHNDKCKDFLSHIEIIVTFITFINSIYRKQILYINKMHVLYV